MQNKREVSFIMKKYFKIIIVCLLIIFTNLNVVFCEEPQTPQVAAHGAVLMDAETGRVLWGKNEHEPLAMASTTKIMTAVLALESGRMSETVNVSSRAANSPKVKMYLSTFSP